MRILNRHQVSSRLGISPARLSNLVAKRDWSKIPKPSKIMGVFRWLDVDVDEWIVRQFSKSGESADSKRERGRPRKKASRS